MVQNPKPPIKFLVHWVLLSSPNYKIHKSMRIFRFHGFVWSDHFWNFKSCWFNAKILDFQLWPESEWRLPFCHSDRWSVAYFGQQPVLSCWHQKDGCWKVFCSHLPHLSYGSAHYVGRIQCKVQYRWRMQTPQSS